MTGLFSIITTLKSILQFQFSKQNFKIEETGNGTGSTSHLMLPSDLGSRPGLDLELPKEN